MFGISFICLFNWLAPDKFFFPKEIMNLFIESPNRAMIQRSGVSISYAFVSALGDDRYGFVALAQQVRKLKPDQIFSFLCR